MDDITRRVNGKTKDLGVEVVDVRIDGGGRVVVEEPHGGGGAFVRVLVG